MPAITRSPPNRERPDWSQRTRLGRAVAWENLADGSATWLRGPGDACLITTGGGTTVLAAVRAHAFVTREAESGSERLRGGGWRNRLP